MTKLLSHEDLHISFPEWGALIATRTMIACGALKHTSSSEPVPHQHQINMGEPCADRECGTVACIGGNMALIMGMGPIGARAYVMGHNKVGSHNRLQELMWPNSMPGVYTYYNTITAKQVLAAIDSYLTTGRANWKAALKV